ncbi:hypothetical protein M758_UG259000 [Ceratodon purpureus]|nr:hypothetical protein M758_UG259000 [Ceratodon purpureus]
MLPYGSCNRPFGELESVTRDGCEASGGRGIGGAATTSLPEPEHHACRERYCTTIQKQNQIKNRGAPSQTHPSTPSSTQPSMLSSITLRCSTANPASMRAMFSATTVHIDCFMSVIEPAKSIKSRQLAPLSCQSSSSFVVCTTLNNC